MKSITAGLAAAAVLLSSAVAIAAPLKLEPANPQPGSVKPGLSVRYAYPEDVKSLTDASAALKQRSEAGRPLSGLDYRDTNEGDPALTSKRAEFVAASIKGYVKFDKAGVFDIDFLTNDGVRARIGGQVVGHFDGRQPCDTTVTTTVEVPQPGWYPVDILYFQRYNTSCLHMRMGEEGARLNWMPNKAFGH